MTVHFPYRLDLIATSAVIASETPEPTPSPTMIPTRLPTNSPTQEKLENLIATSAMIASDTSSDSGGSIFCITSGAARGYRLGRVGYSMSKAALDRMFLSLAEEVREHNIAVNVLSPGRVDTWMNRRGDWPGTAHIPMAEPDEIIPAAIWLAGQSAKSFTGQLIERADFGKTWGLQPTL